MENYRERIIQAKQIIEQAEYILIGAGAGLSTAAGLEYTGRRLEQEFKEYKEKYDFKDLYSASFYDFSTEEEKWAFWAKMIELNRYNQPLKLYQDLLKIVREKKYFIITTNVDAQFEKAGFEKENIYAVQGDYGYIQCKNACHNKIYYNEQMVYSWLKHTENCRIPKALIPKCPVCGKQMEVNLRKDDLFVQDINWYKQEKQYEEFLKKHIYERTVLIELGVGFNTPGIIRFPFENMVYHYKNLFLIRMNKEFPLVCKEIESQTISFNENIDQIIEELI